ncbi:MAG: Nif3-like dinuclear metal center hexameric protein [Planctomycetota bacterium]
MPTVDEVAAAVARIAPPELAEEWDNTGLLLGDPAAPVGRVMTCLTVTPESVAEAVSERAAMIVSHHPLPFRAVKEITTATRDGDLLWRLARAGVALYSPHTAFDSAAEGINHQLAATLGLTPAGPLIPSAGDPAIGAGRFADTPDGATAGGLARQAAEALSPGGVRIVGDETASVARVGFACGSGGSFLDAAIANRCDALVTGEATFHTCLAAESAGVALVLLGHYASERFAVEWLADRLAHDLPGVECWASRREHDPIRAV